MLPPVARNEGEVRVIAANRRARHDFEILQEFEAGLALLGSEVKSLRGGQGSIQEAWVRVSGRDAWLVGAHVPEYREANKQNHETTRVRKLLLHAHEIERIGKAVREKGVTTVPLAVYFKGHLVKCSIALVRGKKLHDKRQTEREREDRKEMRRAVGRQRREA
ncbi:MAG: SsrA-binding protein SmpB [Planctomycetota bacterium]